MKIDHCTLEHLDILGGSHGRTVFACLDRTLTRAGRHQLRKRFITPPATLDEVLGLQAAHREMADALAAYRAAIGRARLDEVVDYLGSAWLLPSRMPVTRQLRSWYRRYRRDAADGLDACRALLTAAATLADLAAHASSPLLTRQAARLRALRSQAAVGALAAAFATPRRSMRAVPADDEVARGAARETLTAIVDCLAELDAVQSVASATAETEWTYPVFGERLQLRGVAHPLLDASAVRNDLDGRRDPRVIFVTGPNMAGKSTFIKAVAVALLLAHVGAAVPAEAMETPFFDALFSSGHVRDDLQRGESLFLAETRRVADLARTVVSSRRTFALLDEPFRGTNVHDASEATLAILKRLATRGDAVVIVASHLAELAPLLGMHDHVALLQVGADIRDGVAVFDHRVRPGASTQRLGMYLLEREGVLSLLDGDGSLRP